jgi:hypothetical protein
MSDFSSKMAAANDDAQYAAADRAFSEAVSAHEVEASTLPPDKHVGLWESKYLPKLETQVAGLKASGEGRARINAMFQRQAGNAYAAIKVGANQKFLESARQEGDAYLERAVAEGRHEDAYAQLERDRQSNLRSSGEVAQRMAKIAEDHKINTWRGYIQQNPAEARKVLREAQTTGKPPKGLRPEQVMQFRREAEGQHAQLLQDVTNQILVGLDSDAAQISNDDIEAQLTRPDIDAPRELIDKIKERRDFAYANTPEGKTEKDTAYSNLWQRIFAYEAEKDVSLSDPDSHKREYQKLLQDIVDVAPEGERKPFMDTLNERVSNAVQGRKSRADEIAKGLTDMTEKLANWEQLGPIGKWKEVKMGDKTEKVPADMAAYQKVQAKRMEITNDIRSMLRENPELTEEQAMERFKGILENRLDGGAQFMKEPDEESWWQKLIPFVQGPMANNPNVVTAGLSFGPITEGLTSDSNLPPSADEPLPPVGTTPSNEPEPPVTNKKIPASIRNNNAGAMWPASWQKKFGGQHGENLADGKGNKIAKFPTPVHGAAATMYLLGNPDYMYSKKTVKDAIATWSAAKGSSLSQYVKAFEEVGFSADDKVGDIMSDPRKAIVFTKTMSRFEAGREFPLDEQGWAQAFDMYRGA